MSYHKFNVVTPPGDMLHDMLKKKGMKPSELAKQIPCSPTLIDYIIYHEHEINTIMAQKLEKVLNIPATIWLEKQNQYNAFVNEQITIMRTRSDERKKL